MRPAHAAPSILDREVLGTPAHAYRLRETLASPLGGTSGASGGQGAYFLATVTVSWRRPLRRRRRITSRPARVRIRLRNPCVRLRLLRCG